MVKDITSLKYKLQMIGKNVVAENSFALTIQEPSGTIRVYQILDDGELNEWLSKFEFSMCELRKHFIVLMKSKPRQLFSLYTKYSQGDILGGLKVRHVGLNINTELPVISVVLNAGVLICNQYGDIRIIRLPEHRVENASTIILTNPEYRDYTFLLRRKERSGALIQESVARWSFDYKTFEQQTY